MISSNQLHRQRRKNHTLDVQMSGSDRPRHSGISNSVSLMHFSLGLAFLILGFREDMRAADRNPNDDGVYQRMGQSLRDYTFCCCCNKLPQMQRLETTKFMIAHFLQAEAQTQCGSAGSPLSVSRGQKQGVGRTVFLPGGSSDDSSLRLPLAAGRIPSHACVGLTGGPHFFAGAHSQLLGSFQRQQWRSSPQASNLSTCPPSSSKCIHDLSEEQFLHVEERKGHAHF